MLIVNSTNTSNLEEPHISAFYKFLGYVRLGRRHCEFTMVGVSKDSSVSIDMVSWFDLTSLHSVCQQTHLLS